MDIEQALFIARNGSYEGRKKYFEALKAIEEYCKLIVRCKDCQYWGDASGRMHAPDGSLCDRCKAHSYFVNGRYIGWFSAENDFCSRGKRRNE